MPLGVLIAFAVVALALVGLAVKRYFDREVGPECITWTEYWVGMALIALVIAPFVGWAGVALAKRDNLTFTEFRNGWEGRARMVEITCSQDGPCRWEYDCDPYQVPVPYECGDGKTSQTCIRYETHYHACPYTDAEYNFYVDTTLGTYTIDTHRLPVNPNQHRWRSRHRIPRNIIDAAGTGEPAFWSAARDRIARQTPWPVTRTYQYYNFVLASRHTVLKQYYGAAEAYRAQRLLPDITSDIRDGSFYRADKVHTIGCSRQSYAAWNDTLEHLNAALGSELGGDVQLVLACNPVINRNPDQYRFALEAHWQDVKAFRRNALPKNTIVIMVGTTDQKTVSWARAFTGMPVGNERMLVAIQRRLMGVHAVPWNPQAVLGTVTGVVSGARASHDGFTSSSRRLDGVITAVLWGSTDRATRFARVSMSAKDAGDVGTGFRYLANEVVMSGLQKFLILLTVMVTSAVVFGVIAYNDFFSFLKQYERR